MHVRLPALAFAAFLLAGALAPAPAAEPQWATLLAPAEAPAVHRWSPEEWAARSDQPPLPGIQDGLGTGSAMRQTSDGSTYICTAAFLLRDPTTGTYYLATAGHCLVKDETDPKAYTGASNPDKMHESIDICIAGCISNALGQGDYVTVRPRDGHHPIIFAQSGGVGRDFGILEIPAELHDDLRPHMPQWGGPTGIDAGAIGDTYVHYGHGSYCCEVVGAVATRTPVDQGRVAVSLGADGSSFSAAGHVTGGDSGSGIVRGVAGSADVLVGAEAVGVITHGLIVAGNEFSGTVLTKGLAMVRGATGLELELVLAGDPLPRGPTKVPDSVNLTVASPTDGATLAMSAKKATVQGTADKAGGLPDGAAVQVAVDDAAFGADSRLPVQGNMTWSATWDFAGEKTGKHVLRARVVDAAGVVLDQANVTVTLASGTGTGSQAASGAGAAAPAEAGGRESDGAAHAKKPVGAPGAIAGLAAIGLAAAAFAARRRA